MTHSNATGTAALADEKLEPGVPDVLARLEKWEAKADAVGRETVEARLDAWQARIEALRIQAHLAGLDARDEAAAPLARVEARVEHARDRLRELAQESADVWTVLVAAYASARDELVTAGQLVEQRLAGDS
jgi:hypothetical protein